jgi:hypothetical protein
MPRNLEPTQIAFPYKIARGALIALPNPTGEDTTTFEILRFQYNPETMTRARTGQWERKIDKKTADAAQIKAEKAAAKGGALKSKSETISFKLVFDATELRLRDDTDKDGILPELSILERFALGPDQLPDLKKDKEFDLLSLAPTEALLILGKRTFPGVITQMSIVEQRFDVDLTPIRAEIDIRFRVLETKAVMVSKVTARVFQQLLDQRQELAKIGRDESSGLAKAIQAALQADNLESLDVSGDLQRNAGTSTARAVVQGEIL